jgi:hypothetical protein
VRLLHSLLQRTLQGGEGPPPPKAPLRRPRNPRGDDDRILLRQHVVVSHLHPHVAVVSALEGKGTKQTPVGEQLPVTGDVGADDAQMSALAAVVAEDATLIGAAAADDVSLIGGAAPAVDQPRLRRDAVVADVAWLIVAAAPAVAWRIDVVAADGASLMATPRRTGWRTTTTTMCLTKHHMGTLGQQRRRAQLLL